MVSEKHKQIHNSYFSFLFSHGEATCLLPQVWTTTTFSQFP